MKIRVEISSLATYMLSGVNFYAKRLTEALDTQKNAEVDATYFNFLNRQPEPIISLKKPPVKNSLIPLRVYAKLYSYGVPVPPFDLFKSRVDLTIFPNFALWPTAKSKLRAAVIHDLTFLHFPQAVQSKNLAHLRRIVPRAIKHADFIITVSETVKKELVETYALDPEKCLVTPVPPEPAYAEKNDNEIHEKYGIPTQKFIFFIGNMEPRKNLPVLIDAYCQLPEKMKKEYALVLGGGKGWNSEKTRQVLQKTQAAGENIVHVGYVDQADSPAFFQKASVFIMPSIYEGFGMPALEAMAAKTPAIISDIPVHREAGGDAVLYADPSKPTEFRDNIIKVLSSQKVANDMVAKGSAQLKAFSWEKIAKKITNYTQHALEKK